VKAELEAVGLDGPVDRRAAVFGFRQAQQGLVESQLGLDVAAEQVDEEFHAGAVTETQAFWP
jgi:hypothetical protein